MSVALVRTPRLRLLNFSAGSNTSAGARTMPLKYLIDENLRGKFMLALLAKARAENVVLDLVESGDQGAPPLGTPDDELLRWAQQAGRVLISLDKRTLPEFLSEHL